MRAARVVLTYSRSGWCTCRDCRSLAEYRPGRGGSSTVDWATGRPLDDGRPQ